MSSFFFDKPFKRDERVLLFIPELPRAAAALIDARFYCTLPAALV